MPERKEDRATTIRITYTCAISRGKGNTTNLHVVGDETGIDGGTGGTHASVELVGERVEDGEVLATLERAAASDNNASAAEVRAIALSHKRVMRWRNVSVLSRVEACSSSHPL